MVTVYSKNNCMQCRMVKKFLTEHDVTFKEINVDENPEFIAHLKDDLNFMATPVVETENIAFYGFAPDKLKALANN
ncbi:glutaredoxin-like protein NrdH [Lactococcus allomyrinae]|uniref:Glutaredoxin-like protein NrdH n=1 Tax=Lactococcus allomyrinae TaxID=2419773 RepID=A0A387BFV8_9LACT|nr:glutaredoxin-like protein NrdH [Lactococcus allomyrinae]AYF99799.1 glutaredoxin-like protein NrdH [Lactococcus allomyrinae]